MNAQTGQHLVSRRGWLMGAALAASTVWAQQRRPKLAIEWRSDAIPAEFLKESLVFTRAYTCCPNREAAQWALEHARFPHAARDGDASVWDFFEEADADDADIVVATMHSADGDEWWTERSIHVPLAIRWPSMVAPRTTGVLSSHADVFPMLSHLAGFSAPRDLQGQDVLTGPSREAVYSEGGLGTRVEWRALVRGYDKIVWNLRNEILGLYNVAEDPAETVDLQDKSGSRLTRDSMWALAERSMQLLEDGRDARGFRIRRP